MDTETKGENPWLRPGFLVSSCVVAVIAALGIYIGVGSIGHDRGGRPTRQVSAAATAVQAGSRPATGTSQSASDADSICGLSGGAGGAGDIDPVSTRWRYSNAVAYPTSAVYGPGRTSSQGYRYCFQRSPGGALFAAANSLAFDNSSIAEAKAWWEYVLADGRYRRARLAESYVPNDPTERLQIIGYRIMTYTGREAWVDIAVRTSGSDGGGVVSAVSHLVWQRGDWRLSTDELQSTNVARISDLTDYTAWSAD